MYNSEQCNKSNCSRFYEFAINDLGECIESNCYLSYENINSTLKLSKYDTTYEKGKTITGLLILFTLIFVILGIKISYNLFKKKKRNNKIIIAFVLSAIFSLYLFLLFILSG